MVVEFLTRLSWHLGQWVGGILIASGMWVIAQASVQDVERWIAGGIIAAIGVFLVRWALKTSERVESTYLSALAAANERAALSEKESVSLRRERDDLQKKYDQERELRMSLEEAGVTDRRKTEYKERRDETQQD